MRLPVLLVKWGWEVLQRSSAPWAGLAVLVEPALLRGPFGQQLVAHLLHQAGPPEALLNPGDPDATVLPAERVIYRNRTCLRPRAVLGTAGKVLKVDHAVDGLASRD